MEPEPTTAVALCLIIAFLCFFFALMLGTAIPSLKVARTFKNAQQWEKKKHQDRAAGRELHWYGDKKEPEKISSAEPLS